MKYLLTVLCICIAYSIYGQRLAAPLLIDSGLPFEMFIHNIDVSKDGNRIAKGSPFSSYNAFRSGHVDVFELKDNNWVRIGQRIVGDGIETGLGYWITMSGDGNKILVCSNGDDNYCQGYEIIDSIWQKRGSVINHPKAIQSNTGNHIVATKDGFLSVYEFSNGDWIQVGNTFNDPQIVPSQPLFTDLTKLSISDDGNTIAAAHNGYIDSISGIRIGGAKIYKFLAGEWTPIGESFAVDDNFEYGHGIDLSSSGETVAIRKRSNFTDYIDIYENINNEWVQKGSSIESDNVGLEIDLSDDGSLIAIPRNSGKPALVYRYHNQAWKLATFPITESTESQVFSTYAIALSDDKVSTAGAHHSDAEFRQFHIDEVYGRTYHDRNSNCEFNNSLGLDSTASISFVIKPGNHPITSDKNGNWYIDSLEDGAYFITAMDSTFRIDCDSTFSFEVEDHLIVNTSTEIPFLKKTKIQGSVFIDKDNNCNLNGLEPKSKGTLLKITPSETFTMTDENGNFYIDNLSAGTYEITPVLEDSISENCDPKVFSFISNQEFVQLGNIGIKSDPFCSFGQIKAYINRLRPCFEYQPILIEASNSEYSFGPIESPYVLAHLDDFITVDSSSHDYEIDSLGNMIIPTQDLAPGDKELIILYVSIDCEAELGTSICNDFTLMPIDSCSLYRAKYIHSSLDHVTSEWNGSKLKIDVECENDSISFNVKNEGVKPNADMNYYAPLRLYEDNSLVLLDSVKLDYLQDTTIRIPSMRNTYRLESEQHPLHIGQDRPLAYIENCGEEGDWTPGMIVMRYLNDADPHKDVICEILTAAFDPNDKNGFPAGVGPDSFIPPYQEISYRIRFQNTGNDTAFNVFILDTLDHNVLDIETLKIGTASHEVETNISGAGILRFDFKNILLVDSLTNEEDSHGFVNYTISPIKDLQDYSIINNRASIYFDFNEPIITNTTQHTILQESYELVSNTIEPELTDIGKQIKITPNPTLDRITLMKQNHPDIPWEYSIYNCLGEKLLEGEIRNQELSIDLPNSKGIYIVELRNGKIKETHKVLKI